MRRNFFPAFRQYDSDEKRRKRWETENHKLVLRTFLMMKISSNFRRRMEAAGLGLQKLQGLQTSRHRAVKQLQRRLSEVNRNHSMS